jgi:hypothetical protein
MKSTNISVPMSDKEAKVYWFGQMHAEKQIFWGGGGNAVIEFFDNQRQGTTQQRPISEFIVRIGKSRIPVQGNLSSTKRTPY